MWIKGWDSGLEIRKSPPLQKSVLEALLIGEEGWVGMVLLLPIPNL
jgi:hypothetical protein